MAVLTQDDFDEWKVHPVTVEMMRQLGEERQQIMEHWAAGEFTHESAEGTMQLNAKMIGRSECLEDMLNLSASDFIEEVVDGTVVG